MGGEKRSSKGGPGGFRSKWKKLFSGKSTSAVEQEQDGLNEENLEFESHMMEDERKSECSCVSSLSIDEEGAGVKAPNVVARLMGLESLPPADLTEFGSTPFYAPKATRGPKKSLQFGPQYLSFHSARQPTSVEAFSGKMMEASPQKLQKLAKIERFQTETLPMKPVKSYSDIQHKLLSPIKSSGFVSAKSAAHLMETAVKIIEPRLHPPAKNKSSIIGSSFFLNDRGRVEDRASNYRICKPLEIPKKLSESNAVKCLKGQAMNKSWNGPEDGHSSRVSSERKLPKDLSPSLLGQGTVENNQKLSFSSAKKERQVVLPQDCPNAADNKPAGARVQVKSVSLAIQAKVNVQKRENCSSSGHPNSSTVTSLLVQDEQDEPALSRQHKNQLHLQKNKQKQATSGATNVLRQNNQKQNRFPKPGDQLARKDIGGNTCRQKLANSEGGRNCNVSSRSNSCCQTRKVGSLRASEKCVDKRDVDKGSCPKGTGDFPRKKRLIEGSFSSEKNGLVETAFITGDKTNQEAEVTTNSFLNQADFKRKSLQAVEQAVSSCNKGTDVVSFTFTSPLAAISRCRPSDQALDRQDKKKSCFRDSYGGKNGSSTKCSKSLEGDALSALLERKLRELTSDIQNADGLKAANSGSANTLSILQDFLSTLNSGVGILKEDDAETSSVPQESNLNHVHIARADTSSSSLTVKKDLRFQVKDTQEHLGTQREHLLKVDPAEEKEHLSPVSILEAAYSNDSCNSFDSADAVYGGPLDDSCHASKNSLMRTDKELLDSANSVCTAAREKLERVQLQRSDACSNEQELEYVRDIVSNTRFVFKEIAVGMPNEIVDPVLFNKLESNCFTFGSAEHQKMKIERKLWFDCVTECVNSKYSQYSQGDCRNWARGAAVIGRTGLADDIFKEMLSWQSMKELKVDEILYKDMSSGPGRWLDFQSEEFEAGVEIEADIFDFLIEEVAIYTFGLEI